MTPKQQRFAEEYMVDSNATAAAKRAGYSPHTANEQGARLLTNVSVAAAIRAGQAELRERTKVTVESISDQLDAAYEQAKENGQAAAMVQACMGLAKLHGLLIDKTEDVTKAVDLTPDELTAELERVQAELKALDQAGNVVMLPNPNRPH